MNKIHHDKITKILLDLGISEIAQSCKFTIRNSKKITPISFLVSFFATIHSKNWSLRIWASTFSLIFKNNITFQALAKKSGPRHLALVKELVGKAMGEQIRKNSYSPRVLDKGKFNRILIEDSTCIQLPSSLGDTFPGSGNQYGSSAVSRVQLCLDLLSNTFVDIDLQSFRDHDAKHSDNILNHLLPEDLIIRDLGYFRTDTFKEIALLNAFYISKLKPGINIYDYQSLGEIDLVKELKNCDKKQIKKYQRRIYLGSRKKVETTLICCKVPEEVRQTRIRSSAKNGNPNISEKHRYLHGWSIIITNVSLEEFSAEEIIHYYTYRWHIEIVFKTWKSSIALHKIMSSCQGPNPIKPELLLYLVLAYIVIVIKPRFSLYQTIIFRKYKKFLSPHKFIKIILCYPKLLTLKLNSRILCLLNKNTTYDTRTDRNHIYEKFILNFLS